MVRPSSPVDSNTCQVCDHETKRVTKSSTWLTEYMSVIMSVMVSVMSLWPSVVSNQKAVFDAIKANSIAIATEIATAIGKGEQQVERVRASLRDAGP